jgi:AmmeMemoRadiSam system protein B
MNRQAAVAGRFYPGRPRELEQTVSRLMEPREAHSAIAVMAPHAGYPYSGRTAGRVFASVEVPDRAVVLCPNHTGMGARLAVWPDGAWELPNCRIPVDGDLTDRILASHPAFKADVGAHQTEHAIEVELPFLHARNPAVRIVAIVVARHPRETLIELGQCLAKVVRETNGPVLIVASSDMSHYISALEAAELDRLALDRVEAMDAAGLYDVVETHGITMCGVMPTTITLAAAEALGAHSSRVIDYTHSGLVTGDDRSVVAYAGAVIS